MEDARIVDLFLQRNEDAIEECRRKYGKGLVTISYRISEDPLTAEECENDTYFEAWKLIPPHEPRTYLFAFLARIIRNVTFDRIRRDSAKKRSGRIVELSEEMQECIPDGMESAEEKLFAEELGHSVSIFLKKLPDKKRQLFVRRYYYMDSIKDLSEMFGDSESKVKSVLFRIRKQLAEYLAKEGYHYEG